MGRSFQVYFGRHLMHFICFRMRQPVPQPTSRFISFGYFDSDDIDEDLASCSY